MHTMQEDDSIHEEFQELCRRNWPYTSWMTPSDPSPELDLRLAEEKLNHLVQSASAEYSTNFIDTRFSADCYNFKCQTVSVARPLLECRQRAAERFNERSVLYRLAYRDIMEIIFDYATLKIQDGYEFPEQRDLRNTLSLASVTRSFRDLALASSFLWSSIVLSEDSINDTFDTFIERTKEGHLHLCLDFTQWYFVDVQLLASKLRSVAHRVRTLHFNMFHSNLPQDYTEFLEIPFPIATVLSFAPL